MVSNEEFEELIERVESLEEEKVELKKENSELRRQIEHIREQKLAEKAGEDETEEISRRSFLRKLGAGAIGLGALSLAPAASKLTITDTGIEGSTGLDFLDSGSQYFKINEGGPVEVTGTDLRLPTGNAIEDGSGNSRLTVGDKTRLHDEVGNIVLQAWDSAHIRIQTRQGQPLEIRDSYGSFDAVSYLPSSSAPGTLELTKANLNLNSN